MDAAGLGTADPNPFSPDFGQTPDHLVGRDRLLGSLGTALASGPRSREFTSLLMGPRGSGKTVMLTELEQRAAASGWIIVSLDASTAGIADRARQAIVHARDVHEGAEAADSDSGRPGRWSGIRLGPLSLQRAVLAEVRPEWDMRHLLAKLAEHAQKAGVGVLMTLDEVHSGDRNELRRLAADLQHITKRANLPLAVAAAGLSEMKHTLLMDKKMTFFRRCARLDLPDLSAADAMEGLRLSVLDAGGAFDQDALRSAAAACGPLPYGMQLVGYNAWKIAGAPQRPIDILAVEEATRVSTAAVLEDLIEPAWHDLPDTSRAFLTAVADLGPRADHQRLAACLPSSPQALADTEQRLRACRYIADSPAGLRLTGLMPQDAVRALSQAERLYRSGRSLQSAGGDGPPAAPLRRCGEYMPRAKAYCVLPENHRDGHRSGKRRSH